MTRAVVFLTTTMLFASLGAFAQNSSSLSGGQSTAVQATAPAQNAARPAVPTNSGTAPQGSATSGPNHGIQSSAQTTSTQVDKNNPRTANSAELPQTSTILPLLGLLGLGSLVAGLFARR